MDKRQFLNDLIGINPVFGCLKFLGDRILRNDDRKTHKLQLAKIVNISKSY